MAKLRHIAISVPDPEAAATFFERAFGMTRAGNAMRGVYMTDGVMNVALLNFGARMPQCLLAADKLSAYGLSTTVADARFAKPLDHDLIRRLVREHEVLITVEEGAIGGFAAHVMQYLALEGLLDRGLKLRPLTLPDFFIDQDSPEKMYEVAGLDAKSIVATALNALGREREAALSNIA